MTNMRGVVGHSEMLTIKLQPCGERRESGVRSGNMIQIVSINSTVKVAEYDY